MARFLQPLCDKLYKLFMTQQVAEFNDISTLTTKDLKVDANMFNQVAELSPNQTGTILVRLF